MHPCRPLVAKQRSSLNGAPPLPIFTEASAGVRYSGMFNGLCVAINEREYMIALYTMGYFGKGSLSRGYPSFSERLQRRNMKDSSTTSDHIISNNSDNVSNLDGTTEDSMKFVVLPTTTSKSAFIAEQLLLMPEEAFFLSFAVNCLQVFYDNQLLHHRNMWTLFQEVQNNFVERYVTYHYFRAKGWIVRSGIKYGGDFVLYREGPPFFHSSYVVFVITNSDPEHRYTLNSFLTYYRATEVAKKDLLICRVTYPEHFEKDNVDHLKSCHISEFLFRRWIPSENRNSEPRKLSQFMEQQKRCRLLMTAP